MGLLDPLRVAPVHLRQEAAVSFLCDLLPARCDAAWITAIVKAVDTVVRLDQVPTCGQVVRVLDNGDATDQQVAKTLAVYESSLVTDTMGDGDTLAPLLGATAVFGVRSDREAARALGLLGLDTEDEVLRRRLQDFSAGRCLLRDHQGRIEAVQVDLASRRLLASLSTTPDTTTLGG